jgi:accessory colonization factor AcfC
MILILNILDNNKAEWILAEKKKQCAFDMQAGQENILTEFDDCLHQENIELRNITGFGLAIKQASLTQVKVQVTIINTLGWQLQVPVVADFYYQGDLKIEDLVNKIEKQKDFKAIKPEYQREAEVTVSKKTPKFTIAK